MDWKTTALTIPQGQKRRIDCDCGSGKTAVITHWPKLYTVKCFRCDEGDYLFKGMNTLEERKHLKELNDRASEYEHTVKLPKDYTQEIPPEARILLFRAGLSESVWKEFGIGYSGFYKRIVLPVYDNTGRLVWQQLRATVEGQKPKYLQQMD